MTDNTMESAAPRPGRVYKTQTDAVSYLNDAGYKISGPTFSRAVRNRKVPRNAEGHFEESTLLGYAGVYLDPAERLEDKKAGQANAEKASASAEKDRWTAARLKLKYEKEQGLLMPKSEHERDLAARALFFKKEVENFIHLFGPGIIHLVGGDENRLPELVAFWGDKTADWMNAWAEEREFLVLDEEEESEFDAGAGQSGADEGGKD